MRRSSERILTTHAGSLIRPPRILNVLKAEAYGEPYEEAAFAAELGTAVTDVVQRQRDAGVDVVSDGEFGKVGWNNYLMERLEGLSLPDQMLNSGFRYPGRDRTEFADFYAGYDKTQFTQWLPDDIAAAVRPRFVRWCCTGPISYKGQAAVQRDIANLKAAMAAAGVEEGFLPVVAPGSMEASQPNLYYASAEEYLEAIAAALREEYLAIAASGLVLQVDDAFMPYIYDWMVPEKSMAEYRAFTELRIEALNHALRGIPEDRIRYHICWGSWNGPHVSDVPLREIVDLLLMVNAQAYSIEAANPRHEHEWMVWQDTKLPEGKLLIPGVVTHSTNVVEHPDLVAWRIANYARLAGRENVIAGTDCGFSQHWNLIRTHESVQWAKLRSLAEGAAIASKQLWP
jgi:5-methyltetrahydropteroyltriglutamate--homocysteine methyltransferase